MQTIKIFLASSSELKSDREQFEIFINRKNKQWVNRGIFLHLLIWEDGLNAMSRTRSQDDYNKAIRECDLFVMLFFTKVGRYTEEEFETAFGQYKQTNKPFIFTYFKTAKMNKGTIEKNEQQSLLNFQKQLSELGHFYTRYKNIEDLLLQFGSQLDKLVDNNFIGMDKPETDSSQKKSDSTIKIFLYVFVLFVAITFAVLYFRYQQMQQPLVFSVALKNLTPNPELPFEKGKITLKYGDKSETQEVEHEAIFKGIPANFRRKRVTVQFEAEGFVRTDTVFVLKDDHISLPIRRDSSLARIFGIVKDEAGNPVADAQISVQNLTARSDAAGRFNLHIPFDWQRREQRIRAFKPGYKAWDYSSPVIANEEMAIILSQ